MTIVEIDAIRITVYFFSKFDTVNRAFLGTKFKTLRLNSEIVEESLKYLLEQRYFCISPRG